MTRTPVRVRRTGTPTLWGLRLLGAALLAATAWIHLDLWRDGYRDVDVIGPAFLLAVVLGSGSAALLLVVPRAVLPWVAALGALVCGGTLAALLVSTWVGLFGFRESTAAALWWESFWVEAAGALVLAGLAWLASARR
ncbi:hypothetical protein [Blastococcus sp. TF02A-30]|uniref:hypothetical protein n=1 Tax=Blastococcus sp. TF02A-30 TaxID=2250580 RepID=UPI000DEBEAD2|nr:hypothetical protein [Blastococcus sp. TF02A-30]RBY91004.1 hypothetical protein DQ241_04785 [Blastococcus sp. TF02A-30]